jgi:SAM-dependent methyltransferase
VEGAAGGSARVRLTATRFHEAPRHELRQVRPWHRLAYIIRALPAGIEELAAGLRLPSAPRVLDYGCADLPYRHLFPADADYLAADLPGNPRANVEIASDGTVPVEDESVDLVLSTQVLEHVEDPLLYLAECRRVLRAGGQLVLSTHGIMVYHPDPDDYWRWTCAGLRRVVGEASMEIERFEGIMGLGATGLQLFQDSLYWRLPRPLRDLLALVLQGAITLADRLESAESRRTNALVFALVARRR